MLILKSVYINVDDFYTWDKVRKSDKNRPCKKTLKYDFQ